MLYQKKVHHVGDYCKISKGYYLHRDAKCSAKSLVPGSPYKKDNTWRLKGSGRPLRL